jgi:hypothetical protein
VSIICTASRGQLHRAGVRTGSLVSRDGRFFPLIGCLGLAPPGQQLAARADVALVGTTLTAMLFSGDRAALVHIGDSRAFRLHDSQLRQITEDHTIGNLVWDAGFLAPVLARYLDGRPDRSADLGLRDLRAEEPVPAVLRRAQPGPRRRNAPGCTNFGR